MENKKTNKIFMSVIIILILLVAGLGGYIVYDKVLSDNKESANNMDKDIEDDSDDNNSNGDKNDMKDYVGKYISSDGNPTTSYIELYDKNRFKRNSNLCEGYAIIEGEYSVTEENGIKKITLITTKNETSGFLWDNMTYSFEFIDNKLIIIDDANDYAYYDCSNTRTFVKQ